MVDASSTFIQFHEHLSRWEDNNGVHLLIMVARRVMECSVTGSITLNFLPVAANDNEESSPSKHDIYLLPTVEQV